MKRSIVVLFAVVIAAVAASTASAAFKDEAQDTVLRFGATKDGKPGVFCSAVVIAPGKLVTAAHCVEYAFSENAKPLWVEQNGKRHEVAAAYPTQGDAAVLIAPGVECPCATVDETLPVKGEAVKVVGFPGGVTIPPQDGVVAAIESTYQRYNEMFPMERNVFTETEMIFPRRAPRRGCRAAACSSSATASGCWSASFRSRSSFPSSATSRVARPRSGTH